MNKLHSFLFSLFFLVTLSCSASEQQSTQYDNTQSSAIKIIQQRDLLMERQAVQSWNNFFCNACTLKDNLGNNRSVSFENNELRLTLAKNLKPIIKAKAFIDRFQRHIAKTPNEQSYRLDYLNTIQQKLRNINELTISTEELEQYIIVVGEIVHPTQPIGYDRNAFTDACAHIYDEIKKEQEQCQLLFLDKNTYTSEQKEEIINRMAEFLKIIHQEEATKKQQG
jgi:hypothetical protein